jgi:hypothetical protein
VKAATPTTVLQDDLRCAGCDYLLRGLDPEGRCPECNHPIRESLLAHANLPTLLKLWRLLFGILILVAILLGLPYVSQFAFSDYPARLVGFYVNREGVFYLLEGVLLLLPGWLLGRPDARRGRAGWIVLGLPATQIILAAVMLIFIRFFSVWGNALLLFAYLLAPFVYSFQMILLLGLLVAHARPIPRGPRALWVRVAQWMLGFVLLIESATGLPVGVARILQQVGWMTQPEPQRYIPQWWDRILTPMWYVREYAYDPAVYFAVLVLLGYAYVIFRRMRMRAVAS